jgi:hypothetical protein
MIIFITTYIREIRRGLKFQNFQTHAMEGIPHLWNSSIDQLHDLVQQLNYFLAVRSVDDRGTWMVGMQIIAPPPAGRGHVLGIDPQGCTNHAELHYRNYLNKLST